MAEGKKTTSARKTTVSRAATRKTTVKKKSSSTSKSNAAPKKTEKEVTEVKTHFNHWQYCNLIGASDAVKYVSKLKFSMLGKKTESEWKKLFQSEGLI